MDVKFTKGLVHLFCFVLLAHNAPVFAQGSPIKVLLAKGKVELLPQGSKGKGMALNIAGTTLQKGDTVNLFDTAQLVLTAGNKAIICSDKGKYSWQQLNTLMEKNGSVEAYSQFFVYLANGLKPSGQSLEDFAKQHATEQVDANKQPDCPDALMVMPYNGSVVIPGTVVFRWKSNGAKHFVFTLYAHAEDVAPVLKQDVNDTMFVLTPKDVEVKMGDSFYWQAAATDLPKCARTQFSVLNPDSASTFELEVKTMRDFILKGGDLSILVVAAVCEQHKMYADADNAYRKLLNDHPERNDIRDLYVSFLGRLGLVDEAQWVLAKKSSK